MFEVGCGAPELGAEGGKVAAAEGGGDWVEGFPEAGCFGAGEEGGGGDAAGEDGGGEQVCED